MKRALSRKPLRRAARRVRSPELTRSSRGRPTFFPPGKSLMNKLHDPELERFKRTTDLVEYAKKAGYEARPHDGATGLTVLDHPNRDRIVVARSPAGPWIYASVPDYEPRAPREPEAHALARLRHCIHRSTDKGSIVEFVQERDSAARRGEIPLERVRERLRAFHATGLGLDVDGTLRPPPSGEGRKGPTDPARDGPQAGGRPDPEQNWRRYDWTPPPPGGPHETQVEQRLRRWREAQAAIDVKLQRRSELTGREPPAPAVAPQAKVVAPPEVARDRTRQASPPDKSELSRRRYDWTPQPAGIETLRGARSRSPGRDR